MNDNKFSIEFKYQISQILDQSMIKIEHCLEQLDESQVWWRPDPNMNSVGNLVLHICGNLTQWATNALNGDSDHRDRQSEFAATQYLGVVDLLKLARRSVAEAKTSIEKFAGGRLLDETQIQGFTVSFMNALMHTASHFQGHVHQIILLTRLLIKNDYRFHWCPESGRDSLPM